MAVSKPTSGSTITPTSVTDMYDSVKDVVNAVPASSVGESAFGPHTLPSCVPNLVGTTTSGAVSSALTVADAVTITKASHNVMLAETEADVVTSDPWATIVEITKSGGYTLPPCKVLVMFDATVSTIVKDTADTVHGQAWFSVYYTVNYGGSDVTQWELRNMGLIHTTQNMTSSTSTLAANVLNKQVSVWFLIDKTHLASDWKIVNIKAVGAVGTGSQALSRRPTSVTFQNANLSFVALHKDS